MTHLAGLSFMLLSESPAAVRDKAGLKQRNIDFNDLPDLSEIDGDGDKCRCSPQGGPAVRAQDDNCLLRPAKFC